MKIVVMICLLLCGCATDTEYFGGTRGTWVEEDLPSCMDVTVSMRKKRDYAPACRIF